MTKSFILQHPHTMYCGKSSNNFTETHYQRKAREAHNKLF